MAEKICTIKLDLNKGLLGDNPYFMSEDKAQLDIELYDQQEPINVSSYQSIQVEHICQNGRIVKGFGSIVNKEDGSYILRYNYHGIELEEPGTIKTTVSFIDQQTEKYLPSFEVLSVDKNMNRQMNLLAEGEGPVYLIELSRFGIVQGSFGKPPYSLDEWTTAYNNIVGFNQALAYANAEGFTHVVVPRGTYSFCYSNSNPNGNEPYQQAGLPITLFSYQTLDLNGSTFEVIYDSINRNPFDQASTNPVWKLAGSLILINECTNTHVINGTIIGDIPNRSFSDGGTGFNSERGMEQTYGIYFNRGNAFCSVKNINVSMFMGDGITIAAYPTASGSWILNPTAQSRIAYPGMANASGTIVQTVPGAYISDKFSLIQGEHKQLQMRTAGGYTRIPLIQNKTFEYLFYNSSDVLLARKTAVYLQTVTVPLDAAYVRIQFRNEAVGLPSITIEYAITKPQSHHITISDCEIHNNHRGGISGGADFTSIKKNKIYHNGMDSGLNIPLFPDSTRYAINFEDSYCNDVTVEDNHIFSSFNGILLGAYHIKIRGNSLSENNGIRIYNNASALIEGNVLDQAGFSISTTVPTQERHILFLNNVVNSPTFSLQPINKTTIVIKNNRLNVNSMNVTGDVEFDGNYVKSLFGSSHTDYTTLLLNVKKCTNNTFEDFNYGSHYRFALTKPAYSSHYIDNNVFRSVSFNSVNLYNDLEFDCCTFFNCAITFQVSNLAASSSLRFTDCTLQDTYVEAGGRYINNVTNGGLTSKASFYDCRVILTSSYSRPAFFTLADNKPEDTLNPGVLPRRYELYMRNCELDIAVTSNVVLMKYGSGTDIKQPRKVVIEQSLIHVRDLTKFKILEGSHGNNANYEATLIDCTFIGFTDLPAPTYGSLNVYKKVLTLNSSAPSNDVPKTPN
ncbi:hypothetical protein [Jeotgalibacillus proteolyticus]|uniref:hypothetical protein n=1 Tax=Jeotgalibacillus proteolyticus TaxID=2082395 RepID=UPI003CF6EA68